MQSDDLSIVIVTFNSEEKMRELDVLCINKYRTFFVDNASKDNTLGVVSERFSDPEIIRLNRNVGYARANNTALNQIETKYSLVVNPDVKISIEGVEELLRLADAHPEFSLIGVSGHEQPAAPDDAPIVSADFVSGSCMLFRMNDFSEIGYFDENFFMYFEDVDLCLRLQEAGLRMAIVRNSEITHREGTSTGDVNNSLLERFWIWGASSRYFYDKHRNEKEGRRARRKILQWQKRKILSFLARDKARYAEACARTQGYSDVKRHGPHIAFQNFFTGDEPQTMDIEPTLSGRTTPKTQSEG